MSLNIVSKYRNAIYGFAILWVVLFHGFAIDSVDYSFGTPVLIPLAFFLSVGNVGVDMFLFLSGICLYFSYIKNPDPYFFIKKRVFRVVPAVLIIYGLYWFIRYGLLAGDFGKWVSRLTLMQFWLTGDQAIWFVSLILLLYFLYPYIYGFLFENRQSGLIRFIILLCLSVACNVIMEISVPDYYELVEVAVSRIPVFVVGCWVGRFVYEKKEIKRAFVPIVFATAIFFFLVLFYGGLSGMERRLFYSIGGISLSYSLALILSFLNLKAKRIGSAVNNSLAWFGAFSLELYLSHIAINQIYQLSPCYAEGSLAGYIVVMLCAILVARYTEKAVSALQARYLTEQK